MSLYGPSASLWGLSLPGICLGFGCPPANPQPSPGLDHARERVLKSLSSPSGSQSDPRPLLGLRVLLCTWREVDLTIPLASEFGVHDGDSLLKAMLQAEAEPGPEQQGGA